MLRAVRGASRNVETLLSPRSGRLCTQHRSSILGQSCLHSTSICADKLYPRPFSASGISASTSRRTPQQMPHRSTALESILHRSHYSTTSDTETRDVDAKELPDRDGPEASKQGGGTEAVQEKFQRLGLNANISRQIARTHPNIRRPTPAQSALIPAILSPNDVILRAHRHRKVVWYPLGASEQATHRLQRPGA